MKIKESKLKITLGYLYGDLMNIYGDTGNIVALKKRAQWRGIEVNVKIKSIKSNIKKGEIDLFFFGGGQDQSQELVAKDLVDTKKGRMIKQEVERGVPLLSICGGYQLLGDYYKPHKGPKLPGVGLFPVFTVAGEKRMIGNIVIESQFGKLIGFENHSGQTVLKQGGQSLGTVIKGYGNNGRDKTEGCIYKHAIGCYMHGSLLPKNPNLADWLLKKSLELKYGELVTLKPIENEFEDLAHARIVNRFR